MKHFIVTIKIQSGEYEKTAITLVQELNEDLAIKSALLGQCHGDPEEGGAYWEDDQTIDDMFGTFLYTIHDCKEVPPEEVPTLQKYL